MVCPKCGLEQTWSSPFCGRCGTQLAAAQGAPAASPQFFAGGVPPPQPNMYFAQRPRVARNVQTLGILWCVFGGYRVITGIVGAVALHALANSGMFGDAPPFVAHLVGSLAPLVLFLSVLLGIGGVLTGYFLLTRRPWARTLCIVMGILALIKLPFGTALGIYTLWVLAPRNSGVEWNAMTGASGYGPAI